MELMWLKDSLFAGMTANSFKLGTVLTLGWFWPRISGCSVLYRGASMKAIDFSDILAVDEPDASQISPPTYVQHNSNTTYFYVVRRANSCGYQEHTLAAAVKVVIDADGELAPLQPNDFFVAGAEQTAGDKVQLVWFYCPIEQKSVPACFNVYYDNGTGQIDYETPLATISYTGRGFYSYQSSSLQAGRYLFAVRAEDSADVEDGSSARLDIELDTTSPEAVSILTKEAF